MGFSSLTRYDIFMQSGEYILSGDSVLHFRDRDAVSSMYFDSARLLRGFEEIINRGDELLLADDYQRIFENNTESVRDNTVVQQINNLIQKQINKNKKKEDISSLSFETFFRYLIQAITDYQGEIIKKNYIGIRGYEEIRLLRNQTFLSYAYDDKGLTQSLFIYFLVRSGFLYVNWMWEGVNVHSSITKSELERALADSNQLLFLRTTNSELKLKGNNNSVRQWCAWEIGNFYTKHPEEKYYTSFYDRAEPRNDILDTFKPMKEVIGGRIVC